MTATHPPSHHTQPYPLFPARRLNAVEILQRIAARKRVNEEREAGEALMERVGGALMAAAGPVLGEPARKELGFEGSLEGYGKALCAAMATFADGHVR